MVAQISICNRGIERWKFEIDFPVLSLSPSCSGPFESRSIGHLHALRSSLSARAHRLSPGIYIGILVSVDFPFGLRFRGRRGSNEAQPALAGLSEKKPKALGAPSTRPSCISWSCSEGEEEKKKGLSRARRNESPTWEPPLQSRFGIATDKYIGYIHTCRVHRVHRVHRYIRACVFGDARTTVARRVAEINTGASEPTPPICLWHPVTAGGFSLITQNVRDVLIAPARVV